MADKSYYVINKVFEVIFENQKKWKKKYFTIISMNTCCFK